MPCFILCVCAYSLTGQTLFHEVLVALHSYSGYHQCEQYSRVSLTFFVTGTGTWISNMLK